MSREETAEQEPGDVPAVGYATERCYSDDGMLWVIHGVDVVDSSEGSLLAVTATRIAAHTLDTGHSENVTRILWNSGRPSAEGDRELGGFDRGCYSALGW